MPPAKDRHQIHARFIGTAETCQVQADKIKADAVEAEKRAADEALQHEEAARQSAAQAQQDYERDIEDKLLRLPKEPTANEPDSITVLIRSPKGQKFGRR